MYARAICKKCHSVGHIDIENLPKDKIIDFLKKMDFGECPLGGFHVEVGKLSDYIYTDLSLPLETIEPLYLYDNMPDIKFGTFIKIGTNSGVLRGYFLQLEKLKGNTYNHLLYLNETNGVERISLKEVNYINQYNIQ